MHALSLRGIPDGVYSRLRNWSRRNHRSLHQQILTILERESALLPPEMSAPARWRQRLRGRRWGPIVSEIRRERSR